MISGNLRKLAADSNVILSAAIGKAALRVLIYPEIEIITTQFNIHEVEEYLPQLASQYQLDPRALFWQLKMLPIQVFPERHYKSHLREAAMVLKLRDAEDSHLLALAIEEKVPIWSNDKDFSNVSVSVYTTAQLLKIIELS